MPNDPNFQTKKKKKKKIVKWPFVDVKFEWNYKNKLGHTENLISFSFSVMIHLRISIKQFVNIHCRVTTPQMGHLGALSLSLFFSSLHISLSSLNIWSLCVVFRWRRRRRRKEREKNSSAKIGRTGEEEEGKRGKKQKEKWILAEVGSSEKKKKEKENKEFPQGWFVREVVIAPEKKKGRGRKKSRKNS